MNARYWQESRQRRHGWIEVVCGSMFSGKSEELIRRVRRATIAQQRVQVFKPTLDDRYAPDAVSTHTGMQKEATRVRTSVELAEAVLPDTQVVAIDEIQFFDPAVVDLCRSLADSGRRVIVSGLDLDFRGEPFGVMPQLLAIAEYVDKLQAICIECGEPATRTQRLLNGAPAKWDDPVIMVGADEAYQARCRYCHQVESPSAVELQHV